jgi:twitching motility two-component system response regulator PilG
MQNAKPQQMMRQHIFAVNSSPEFLDLVRDLLQEEQFNVTTTNYVPRTFDQIAALQPDLLLVDLAVGLQAGWDLLERLQRDAITRGIPVVVTSTDSGLLERAEADRARFGGDRYIMKPLDLDVLLDAVRELIGEA